MATIRQFHGIITLTACILTVTRWLILPDKARTFSGGGGDGRGGRGGGGVDGAHT